MNTYKKLFLFYYTGSLIYHIFLNNVYENIRPHLVDRFDTSDYPDNTSYNYPKLNKKHIGFERDGPN